MKSETLEALKGSIAKWEAIVEGTGTDKGTENCPLCRLFHQDYTDKGPETCCDGCPVFEHTGVRSCGGTPYSRYEDDDEETAKEELDFLKSLLPAGA